MFNPFKKKSGKEDKKAPLKEAAEKKESAPAVVKEGKISSGPYPLGVLRAARITEKSTDLSQNLNKYVFETENNVNAYMIKSAVEKKYGVKVVKVNVLNQPGRKVRLGRQEGRVPGFKKAVVTLAKGNSIELT